jgi:M6 family metalloprotease-like protein
MCECRAPRLLKPITLLLLLLPVGTPALALEKPTPAEIARYQADGTLAERIARARALGNNRADSRLLDDLRERLARWRLRARSRTDSQFGDILPALPPATRPGLPSKGTNRIFALLIEFPDYPATVAASTIDWKLYADGDPAAYPYESLRNYYRRSSYGMLELEGATLGWYRPSYPRSTIVQTTTARENLIKEALTWFDAQGHDFSQYDNNGDGVIDYFCVFWTGPDNGWANFWWGYYTSWSSQPFTLDGKQFAGARYSWQWETRGTGNFTPTTVIHETGHALGLPDLYDYDATVGPKGGVGGLDMMDANAGDHNCFSKMLLDWLTPRVSTSGTTTFALLPTASSPQAVIVWPTYTPSNPFTEFFMVQNRSRVQNDSRYPTDGLVIWHIDATLSAAGSFYYDNSRTTHKLVRLMEADGAEHIERATAGAHAADFYTAGKRFGPDSTPNSNSYSGTPTTVIVDGIAVSGTTVTFAVSSLGPPANLTAVRQTNRSALQSEQVVDLRWTANPDNASLNVTHYRIYRLNGTSWVKIAEMGATETSWRDRKVPKTQQTYGVVAVAGGAVESAKATIVK